MQLNMMVLLLISFIGLMLLFAQLKIFQIADDVRKIREQLEDRRAQQ